MRLLGGRKIFFLFNFTSAPQTIKKCGGYRDYLTKKAAADEEVLERNDFLVLEEMPQ